MNPAWRAGFSRAANTPVPVIRRLNEEIARAVNTPEVKEQFESAGLEIIANSPEAFAAFIQADMAKMGKVIRDAGIREP